MDKVSDKNSAKAEDEIEEKELSEMDVKKIMIPPNRRKNCLLPYSSANDSS